MRTAIVFTAALAVVPAALLAQPAATSPAAAAAPAAPAPAPGEAKDKAVDKRQAAKEAVRALNGGHRTPPRVSAAAKSGNGVTLVPKKKPAATTAPSPQAAPAGPATGTTGQ